MPFHHYASNLNELHHFLVEELVDRPEHESAPRGMRIKELIAPTITLTDPRNRLITSPARDVNYGFAVGELCWYVRGDRDLETMLYYNKRMAQFSDDGRTINSAYGARLMNSRWSQWGKYVSQLDNVVQELHRDPDSRRAVMHINEPYDLMRAIDEGSKDVPCTMSLQLFIRDRRLHMHVLMRSNDVIWGFPYDAFSFTCLMECFLHLLQEAGVPVDDLGHYHHTAGSLHLYERHWDMARAIKEESLQTPLPMSPFSLEKLRALVENHEPDIRLNRAQEYPWQDEDGTIDWMLNQLILHRRKRDGEERARREAALTELIRISEECGAYEKEASGEWKPSTENEEQK